MEPAGLPCSRHRVVGLQSNGIVVLDEAIVVVKLGLVEESAVGPPSGVWAPGNNYGPESAGSSPGCIWDDAPETGEICSNKGLKIAI